MTPVFITLLILLSAAARSWPEAAAHRLVPALYVFGDSTFDVGNNNYLSADAPKANYRPFGIDYPGGVPTGRFSNGYLGVDFMAKRLGFKKSPAAALSLRTAAEESRGANYASGGSGVLEETGSLTLNAQIRHFEATVVRLRKTRGRKHAQRFLSRSIFALNTFNNDIFAFFRNIDPLQTGNTTRQDQYISLLLAQFQQQLETLYGLGARKMVVFSVAPLGCPPSLRRLSPTGECLESLNKISRRFNAAFKEKLRDLSSKLHGLKYSYVNGYDVYVEITTKALEFGFKETKSACCGSGKLNAETFCTPNSTYCSNRNEYLFWDSVHPTQAHYKKFFDLVYSDVPGFIEPISLSELVRARV